MKFKLSLVFWISLVLIGCSSNSPFIMTDFGEAPFHYAKQGLTHRGIDIRVNIGTPVIAVNDGKVVYAQTGFDGRWLHPEIRIKHQGDIQTIYVHIDQIIVELGQDVKQGQIIAYTARTGKQVPNQPGVFAGAPHLHFETEIRATVVDPITLGFTCPKPESKWWWPVGCDSYKGFIVPIPTKVDKPKQPSEPEEPLVEIPPPKE